MEVDADPAEQVASQGADSPPAVADGEQVPLAEAGEDGGIAGATPASDRQGKTEKRKRSSKQQQQQQGGKQPGKPAGVGKRPGKPGSGAKRPGGVGWQGGRPGPKRPGANASGGFGALTMADISADKLTLLAKENWSAGAAGDDGKRPAYKAELVAQIYREELGGDSNKPPTNRRCVIGAQTRYRGMLCIVGCGASQLCPLAMSCPVCWGDLRCAADGCGLLAAAYLPA